MFLEMLNNKAAVKTNLSLFFNDDTGRFGGREEHQWSLDGCQDEVSVSFDHRVQVLPLWVAAVVHSNLI